MDFVYYYKTSDGQRHEGEIGSPDREQAFAALRERGIRAIKVVPKGLTEEGARELHRRWGRITVVVAVLAVLVAGGVFWTLGRWSVGASAYTRQDGSRAKGANQHQAQPMTRRQINGDAHRIADAITNGARFLFKHPSEAYLAAYAQPGANVVPPVFTPELEADFSVALKEPIWAFPDEMREYAELKRIVAGMKEELKMFLASGGTVHEYARRLEQRQKMEADYKRKAMDTLSKALEHDDPAASYAAWENANEWLSAMGLEELPLPEKLISYQETMPPKSTKGNVESTPMMVPIMK